MQSFFEMATYLSSTIDIIKLKKVILSDMVAKHQDEIIFNNILISKHNLDNELLLMNSPERSALTPNEMLPLTKLSISELFYYEIEYIVLNSKII